MFWNKKEEKDTLPDLPPLKSQLRPAFDIPKPSSQLPPQADDDTDGDDVDKHGLPSFPDSPLQKGFAQSAIKDAITQEQIQPEPEEMPKLPSMKTVELDSDSSFPKQPQAFTLDEPPEKAYSMPRKPLAPPKANEIFVKVERFNTAYKSILSISKKVDDIDSALRKIREVKMREEQELVALEKELSSLKSRLQEINDNLFE